MTEVPQDDGGATDSEQAVAFAATSARPLAAVHFFVVASQGRGAIRTIVISHPP